MRLLKLLMSWPCYGGILSRNGALSGRCGQLSVSLEVKLRKFTTMDMSVYFGDLLDHLNKIWDTLEECKEVIEVFKDSDYVLSTERINRIMRILTIFSSHRIAFYLVISSIFGMNVSPARRD